MLVLRWSAIVSIDLALFFSINGVTVKMNTFDAQESKYEFPYHYTPYIDDTGHVQRHRLLVWGYEYLCYILHVKEIIEGLSPATLLDVGCGDGRLIQTLSQSNKQENYLGIDVSKKAIKFAKAFNDEHLFKCDNVENIDQQFDMVTVIEVIEHIPDDAIQGFITSIFQKVKRSGRILISVPTTNVPLHKKHYRHYDIGLLREHLSLSNVDYKLESVEYIFNNNDILYKFWQKFTNNRYFYIAVAFVDRLIWERVWNKLRSADPSTGMHLVALVSIK